MSISILFVYINRFKDYPILYEYCTQLQSKGNQVYYLGISEKEEHFIDSSGVEVFHISKERLKSKLHLAILFAQLRNKVKPDLVHVFHFRWSILLPLVTFLATRFVLDVRTVHVVNKSGKHSFLTPLKNRLTWFESLFFVNGIALTEEIRKMLSPSFKKIPIIPLGANLSKLRPPVGDDVKLDLRKQLGIPVDKVIFIYSGTINPIRQIDVLVNAFEKLSLRTDRAFLIIAGNDIDSANTLEELKTLASSLKIQDRILFTGFVKYDLLIQYYHASDIGLCYIPQVSYFDIQPPTKLFEYMAAELLTISTDTTVARTIISDGVNGLLSNADAVSFSQCMFLALTDCQPVAKRFVKEAQVTVKSYGWEFIIRNYLIPYYKSVGLKCISDN